MVAGQSVEPCREAAEVLEPVEAAFDAVAGLVDQRIMRDGRLAGSGRGDGVTVTVH